MTEKIDFFSLMKFVAPGTSLRIAIDDILRARMGALIVIGMSDEVMKVLKGGFKVDYKFSPQKIVELCKMDGAVVLDDGVKKILYANVLLAPDPEIKTNETGTRHQAAERTSKQTKKLTVAISERRKTVTLYFEEIKYVLKYTQELVARAIENLLLLEKEKEIFDNLLMNLNVLEITNLITITDVSATIERAEIIGRIEEKIKRQIAELGNEGFLIKTRLKELTKNVKENEIEIIGDYAACERLRVMKTLSSLTLDELEHENIIRALERSEEEISSKGTRLLKKAGIEADDIKTLVKFGTLDRIMNLEKLPFEKVKEEEIKKKINKLKENILLGKRI